MTTATAKAWDSKRTDETRMVENALKSGGFACVDAYRFNSASIRVRVIDSRFEGMPDDKRDAMIEALLDRLPEATQGDIITLLTFAPSELDLPPRRFKGYSLNNEFEEPSPSRL